MQYKKGEAPVEPSKRATSGSKGREGTKQQPPVVKEATKPSVNKTRP